MEKLVLFILLFSKISNPYPLSSNYNPVVTTKIGTLHGLITKVEWNDRSATTVHIYYGIPYAVPPVMSLRFKKPVPFPERLDAIHNTTSQKLSCHQYNDTSYINNAGARMWVSPTSYSEDCLYLNVWVPQIPAPDIYKINKKSNEKLAVMVWIYGGSFASGSAGLEVYEGRYLAARQNVIVVSMNYRLGPFGFIYLQSGQIPGNMGLWDQRLALKWVKDNIEYFGGDPDRITIFGESAGAVSVSAHVISPWSQNLFRNAIMQSGSVLGYWGLISRGQSDNRTKILIEKVGCQRRTLDKSVECMRNIPAKQLTDAHAYMYDFSSYFSVPFPPVVENHFLPYPNSQAFKNLAHLKPSGALMLGMNKNEGSYFMLYSFINNSQWMKNNTEINIIDETDYENKLTKVLDLDSNLSKNILSLVDFEYTDFDQPNKSEDKVRRLEEMSSDRSFKCPTIEMARLVTNDNRFDKGPTKRSITLPTYFYEFRYRTKSLPWPKWMGTIHGLEIDYVFGVPFNKKFEKQFYNFSDEERGISDAVMQYWANFARHGDPNIMPNDKLISDSDIFISGKKLRVWPEFDNVTESYLIINDDGKLSTSMNPKKRKCLFWRRWYPVLLKEAKSKSGQCHFK